MPNIFSISVPPNAIGAREARQALGKAIASTDIPNGSRNGLLLSTAEWIINLSKHPNRKPTRVDVTLNRVGDTFVFELEDDGSPFEDFQQTISNGEGPPNLEESGMGLPLMARYFPEMSYIADKKINRLRLQFHTNSIKGKPRILLIDDDQSARNLYGEFLKEKYCTFLADSADEALQILRQIPVDLIISDIQMPNGASGIDLCTGVRCDRSLETISFIFLTGEICEQTRITAHGLAIDDYLVKPVRKAALLNCVERVTHNANFIRNRLGNRFDEDLTRMLHPWIPDQLGSFKTSTHWQTAEAGGGDLLIHHRMDSKTLIVLADLMGHGSQAKFYSHALAGYLSGMLAAIKDLTPDIILTNLNKAFTEDTHLKRTIATAVVLLVSDDGHVQISNAGQPKPLLIGIHTVEHLPTSGSLLGLSLETEFKSHKFSINKTERIFLYTDGLSEIGETPETHEKNFTQIRTILENTASLDISDASAKVEECIDHMLTGLPRDDLTFVILEYCG